MSDAESPGTDAVSAPVAFVVRASRDAAGRLTGVVERVSTGEKVRFSGAQDVAEIIDRMVPGARA